MSVPKGHVRASAGAIFSFCCAVAAFAQPCVGWTESPGQAENHKPSVNASPSLIRLDVEVTGADGQLVTGLRSGDFALFDNGKQTSMASFREFSDEAKPRDPVEMILVLDLADLDSLTNKQKGNVALHAVENVLREGGGRLQQPTSVYVLTKDGLAGSAEPSRDGIALATEVARQSLPRRTRSLADSWFHIMPLQAEALGAIALEQRSRPARKILIWTGPGWPSKKGRDERLFLGIVELLTRLREAHITVWSGTQWPDSKPVDLRVNHLEPVTMPAQARYDDVSLQALVKQTGGGTMTARSIENAIKWCEATANAYYSITFNPARTAKVDDYHTIQLEVANRHLTARTYSGYFDEPVFYDQRPPMERLSVAQLEAEIESEARGPDGEIAKELGKEKLTERLSTKKFEALWQRLPGARSREALEALADRSAFLSLPEGQILADPPPAPAVQEQILDRAVRYVKETLARLPDLYATRTTARFHEPAIKAEAGAWKEVSSDESLQVTQKNTTTVLVRGEKEVAGKPLPEQANRHELVTVGTFGPILEIALSRAEGADLKFSDWERSARGPVAVFRYAASRRSGGLHVDSCCMNDPGEAISMESAPGFHGEMVVDPASGAILRLTVEIDLKPGMPISRSAVMVEYAPVTIGGRAYVCPVHSVAISRQRIEWALHEWGETFEVFGRYETLLNDVTFTHYHLFRSGMKILPGYVAADGKP